MNTKQILCLAEEPWSSIPGRSQQLMTRLRDVQVLYFAPSPGLWDRAWRKPGRKVRPNITVYTLPPVLVDAARFPRLFHAAQRRVADFIARCAEQRRFSDPLLWVTSPVHVHLLDRLSYGGLVYDCAREWDDEQGDWEGSLAHVADLVFAASPGLSERLSPCSANIALLPNGVNYPLFSGEGSVPRRDLLPRVSGPLLGFAGSLHSQLDLAPVLRAALERPDWTFLLLGRQGDNPLLPRLRQLDNVLLPGPCPLTQVPDYLGRCDVLLELLRTDQPYSDVVPTRLYEYLSTGKPVVAMLWPDQVEQFPDVVYAAHSPQEFVRMCRHALEEDRDWVAPRRRGYGRAASWSDRAAQVARILDTAGLF